MLQPQPGPQTAFLESPADAVVYGGAAGGGKSWALLFEPLRHINLPNFRGVLFRQSYKQIMDPGGLWEKAEEMYPLVGGKPKQTSMTWTFPSGAKIMFAYMGNEKDKFKWQGAEIDYAGWDELTHFTPTQYSYLWSRLRNPGTNIRTYMRMSTNPEATSWVRDYIAPWVWTEWRKNETLRAEMEDRRPRTPKSGEILYVQREGQGYEFYWPEEVKELGLNRKFLKSLTFIKSLVSDNAYLVNDGDMEGSEYVQNLHQLDFIERQRLLTGDWDVDYGDTLFDKDKFQLVDDTQIPWSRLINFVRYWDMAATDEEDDKYDKAAFTCGVLMAQDRLTGVVYILDVWREKRSPTDLHAAVWEAAHTDREWVAGLGCSPCDPLIFMEQEPGSSGNDSIMGYAKDLLGFPFEGDKVTGEKTVRAKPLATAAQNNMIRVRIAPWTPIYMNEVESYPLGKKKDQIDATAGGLSKISQVKRFFMV